MPLRKGDREGMEEERATAVKYQSKYWRKVSAVWEMHNGGDTEHQSEPKLPF